MEMASSAVTWSKNTNTNTYAPTMNPARLTTDRKEGASGSPDFFAAFARASGASARDAFGLFAGGGPVGRGLRRLAIEGSLCVVPMKVGAAMFKYSVVRKTHKAE